jgi:zinc finger SWIM domain-containing protein 3
MQMLSADFMYVLDMNDHQQLRSVFWIHPRSRVACSYFGDVITFDTTYLTNTYKMPFAPFVGVNHHGQSTLLGCALLTNEKIETFEWVFNCWLQANKGVAPRAIITDQDKAMEAAVKMVFPNARHRFCLWHILKKVPEKIGHICSGHKSFMDDFDACIYDCETSQMFEQKWDELIQAYPECQQNDWLTNLYEVREKWVPVYLKDTFFAGMVDDSHGQNIHSRSSI